MKKPILVSLILLNLPLKALMLEAPTTCWSVNIYFAWGDISALSREEGELHET